MADQGITIPPPILAALISSVTAAVVSWAMNRKTRRDQERSELRAFITQLNMIAIQYPYVEDDAFCAKWPSANPPAEADMRYDNYCCLVFNLLERLWKHYKGRDDRIHAVFGATEMIRRHRVWWRSTRNRVDNLGGYDLGFIQYVDTKGKTASEARNR